MTKNTGGYAFPVPNDANMNQQEGMFLRDYFAAKAPMPNAIESCDILGWKCRDNTPIPDDDQVAMQKWRELPRFEEKWKTISNLDRAACCAQFQFIYADAMILARDQ